MQQKDDKVPHERYGGGQKKKRKIPSIAQGRYTADFFRMTKQIAYHCGIRDSSTKPADIAREQRIIDSCTEHLENLKEKIVIKKGDWKKRER